jgi:cephalosporin-C deacetylase-like acetyl esterase
VSNPKTSNDNSLSRRALLRNTALGIGAFTASEAIDVNAGAMARQQNATAAAAALTPFNHFPRMMQDYFVARLREIAKRADARRAALKTKADAEAYVQDVRHKIRQCFGAWPEKTPLNPRVTGTLDRDGYSIEKVIFESRPNFPVTANLYVPKTYSGSAPGIVSPCGHAANGKADSESQSFGQSLAKQGYFVLIYDPIGQGERMQYVDAALKPRHGGGTSEHLYAGAQQFLVGEFFGTWRAWDGIRALDYLMSRPEIDPHRVGVTGHSGGGTITGWLTALEDRWAMSAPSCFVTTFLRNLENELPADTEQCPPHTLAFGLDHSDFIAAFAPKPAILLDEERDFFDVRGAEEAYARLKQLYKLLGMDENIQFSLGPGYHSYGKENREAMYRFFGRVTKARAPAAEPLITIEKDNTLWCMPNGQVAESNPRTVFSFTKESSEGLTKKRKLLDATELKTTLLGLLKIDIPTSAPDYRILRPNNSRKYPKKYAATYAVETEPNIFSIVYRLSDDALESRIPRGPSSALLYVSHRSADDELRTEPLINEIIQREPTAAFFACDVRGIGESQPNTCGTRDFTDAYGYDYFYAIHSIMLDHPYIGQKTYDILRLVALLKVTGHQQIHIVGKGFGAIAGTFAAVLSPDVTQVTLKNAPESYSAIAESEDYSWPLSAFVPGVLKVFDLPDCYRALEPKNLRNLEPLGPHGFSAA